MNITKAIGIGTSVIPIAGILIGGITFGINFKTDVQNIKTDVANQQQINADVEEWFSSLPGAYDDSLLWAQADSINERIDNIHIPDRYDDSYLDERIQSLALQVIELRTELDNIETQDMDSFDDTELRGRIAELEGSLQAISNIEVNTDGAVDVTPLIVSIASLEGTLDTVRTDIRTMKSDIKDVERVANSAKSTADSAKSSSGGSRTVENNYDDSDLRSRVSAVERQINSIPTTSSSGSTIQRVENPFDDSSLRSDISRLQTAVAVLEAAPNNAYNDSDLQDRIDDIQWELDNLDIPTFTATDVGWLEDLMYDIKNELSMRIDELEWASDTTTTTDDMYAEKWLFEDLQMEVMFVQEQVWELQTLINDSQTTSTNTTSNNTTTTSTAGRSWDGAWDEPYWIYVSHVDGNGNHSYTGDYWMDGYWNGEPVWINWACGTPGGQWEYCYIFKYNYASWVIQPLEPSNEWLANAYTDGEWPWSGTWNGDVNSVEVKGQP